MKIKYLIMMLALALLSCGNTFKKQEEASLSPTSGIEKAEKFGWHLAIQSYSFNRFTVEEALNKTKELGVKNIEIYPGHKLGGQWGDVPFGFNMTPEQQKWVTDLAKSKGIKIVATGVFTTDDAEDWPKLFEFAKTMKMDFITCEPNIKHWDVVESLSVKTGVKVSVHNHPQPSNYWNPNLLLTQIKDRSTNIGSCSDVGHWSREGLHEVEGLAKLRNRIVSLHFKDIEPVREDGHFREDTIWGKGSLNMEWMLKELQQQGFKGVFSIEYENNWDNSVPDIKECIKYYDELTSKIF